jgi:transposase InsO family protein
MSRTSLLHLVGSRLSVVLDLFSRRVVGWAMAATFDSELVEQALSMAVTQRKPPQGLLHHSYAWNL